MQYKFVEATGNHLYLKALIGRFDQQDWARKSEIARQFSGMEVSLLRQEGHTPERSFFILDLSKGTGGAILTFGGQADYDINHAPAVF